VPWPAVVLSWGGGLCYMFGKFIIGHSYIISDTGNDPDIDELKQKLLNVAQKPGESNANSDNSCGIRKYIHRIRNIRQSIGLIAKRANKAIQLIPKVKPSALLDLEPHRESLVAALAAFKQLDFFIQRQKQMAEVENTIKSAIQMIKEIQEIGDPQSAIDKTVMCHKGLKTLEESLEKGVY